MRALVLVTLGLVTVGAAGGPVVYPQQADQIRPLVLVPIAGTWTADHENAQQILTINGEAPRTAPDAGAVASLFGGEGAGVLKALAEPGAFPLAVARDLTDFRAGRLQVQFKIIAGATDQTAGLVFNLKPDGSYTYARYNTKDGNVAVWKWENGARAVLQHGELHEQLAKGEWHTLDVQVTGSVVSAAVNGKLTVRHTLPGPVSGRVGVWTKTDSVTAFRRFTARH